MFKVNNKDTRTTPWRRSGIFIVNFEHTSSSVSIVNFEQVNTSWNLIIFIASNLFLSPENICRNLLNK